MSRCQKPFNNVTLCKSTQTELSHIHFFFPCSRSSQTVEGKPLSMVGTPSHQSHLGSFSAVSRGPLEPPKISKPWSLSCLRPAPPLKPSAALGYKEVRGSRAAHTTSVLPLSTHMVMVNHKVTHHIMSYPQAPLSSIFPSPVRVALIFTPGTVWFKHHFSQVES